MFSCVIPRKNLDFTLTSNSLTPLNDIYLYQPFLVLFLLLDGLALLSSLLALTSHKWYYVRFGKRVMLLLYYLFAHNKRELFYENLWNIP